ncbi:MAG: zinc ribbon domain-containing protein [Firmicutes bacterium]|nr:zinc ribbon domain-containing protein [Bacillota bacterium]
MFCIKCGKELNDDSAFCSACGAKVSDNNSQQFSYGSQQMEYGIRNISILNYQMTEEQQKEALVAEFASKVRILGIVWLVIGILQVVTAPIFIVLYGINPVSIAAGLMMSIFLVIIGIYNIVFSIGRLNYVNKFIKEKRGMTEYIRKNGLRILIGNGIVNISSFWVIGILAVAYEVFVYNYGKEHEVEFWQIEESMQDIKY